MAPQEKLLTPTEVAERLSVHQTTVRRWIADGHLRAYETPGGYLRIAPSEVERFLRDSQTSSDGGAVA